MPLLTLTDLPLFLPFCSSVDSELTSLCQSVLEDFNLCLFYLPSSPNLSLASEEEEEYESGYAFLPDLLLFQMVIICLMSVHSLKRAGNLPCIPLPWPPCWVLTALFCSSLLVNFFWSSLFTACVPSWLWESKRCRTYPVAPPGNEQRQQCVPSHRLAGEWGRMRPVGSAEDPGFIPCFRGTQSLRNLSGGCVERD